MLFKQFQESDAPDRTYRCEACERTFHAVDILLVPPPRTFTKPKSGFRFVNKFGKVIAGVVPPSGVNDDRVYCCPYCKHGHVGAMLAI